jgi:hypothetical protein
MDWDGTAKELGFENEEAMWESLYVERQIPIRKLADIFKCGSTTLVRRMDTLKITKRSRGGAQVAGTIWKLFYVDQRVLYGASETELGKELKLHHTSIYKYKRQAIGGD